MKNSSIILINPWQYLEKEIISRIWPPLSLANCAALLRERGLNVSIIDANAERLSPKEVAQRVREIGKMEKVFITSTPIDRWQCPFIDLRPFVECVEAVKAVCEDIGAELYVMGAHGTVAPEKILDITNANAVIIGEPELAVVEICEKNLKNVDGLCYRVNGKVVKKQRKKLLNLDELPLPAFDLLPMEKYFYELLGKDFALLEFSRGCPFNCIFCLKKMYGRSYRKKSLEKITKEIEYVINSGVKNFYFIDLEFTVNKGLIIELCNFLVKKRKEGHEFNWCCQTRADTVDKEVLGKMRDAGCKLIHFGIESGSPRMIDVMNKGTSLKKIEEGVKTAMSVGIWAACFFMIGLPTETESEMKETIEFAKKLNPTYASFHVAIPYSGSAFGNVCGVQVHNGKTFFQLCDPSRDYKKLRAVVRNAYLQFYLRPSYLMSVLKRNPKLLTKQLKLFLRHMR